MNTKHIMSQLELDGMLFDTILNYTIFSDDLNKKIRSVIWR